MGLGVQPAFVPGAVRHSRNTALWDKQAGLMDPAVSSQHMTKTGLCSIVCVHSNTDSPLAQTAMCTFSICHI